MSNQACGPIDFVFLQDLSGSFTDDLPILKAQIPNVIASVEGSNPDADFGVASFIDKPTGGFGGSTDYVYRTDLMVSTDNASVVATVNGLSTRSGADGPEAQLEGLLQTALRADELGYRADSTRVVMLSTDSAFHVAGDFASQPANNLDAVLDGTPAGTGEDYPTIDGLRAALVAAHIFPVFSVTAAVRPLYEDLVAQLGIGAVVTLTSDSVNFSDAVRTAIGAACGVITHSGTDGDDDIDGSEDDDGIFCGLGDDIAHGLGGDDIVDGGAGDDDCHGDDGNDDLRGGTGNDDLYGDAGDDDLSGGLGDDVLYGGSGADVFIINAGDGIDVIADFEDGIDRIDLSSMDKAAAASAVAAASDTGTGAKITFADGSSVVITGLAVADLDLADVILDPANAAPITMDDAATTIGTDPVSVAVLANDTDIEGAALTVIAVSASANGTAVIGTDGTITYTANAGFVGIDRLTYTVSDGARTASAVMAVTVERDLTGGPDDDYLVGTAGIDLIEGFDGNDQLFGLAGDDRLEGGAGDDILNGGIGRDTINGGDGDDTITGGPAFDPENPDDDILNGGKGNDVIDGGSGDDTILGGAGTDTLSGGRGDDKLDGGNGNDVLYGGDEHDELVGGNGDDLLDGGAGNDQFKGGSGHDTYVVGLGDDEIEEDAAPAGSFDTLLFIDSLSYADLTVANVANDLEITFTGGSVRVAGHFEDPAKAVEALRFADGGVFDFATGVYTPAATGIVGTDGDDQPLNGTAAAETIDARGGNDRVFAMAGDDIIIGGAGNDVLFGQDGADTYMFSGAFGQDIVGDGVNSDADVIAFTDLLASDIRLFSTMADQLGIDVLGASDQILISEQMNAVTIETLRFADGSTMDLTGGLALNGTRAAETMQGTAFDDDIRMEGGADVVYGQLGDDAIRGGGGNDRLYGDTSFPTALSGGADMIWGQNGDDTILAGAGNDKLFGGNGDDFLFAFDGDDVLKGGNGADVLSGDGGRDKMYGGADADRFVMTADGDRNWVRDFETGVDVLDFSGMGLSLADLSIREIQAGKHVLIDAGTTEVILSNIDLTMFDDTTDFLF